MPKAKDRCQFNTFSSRIQSSRLVRLSITVVPIVLIALVWLNSWYPAVKYGIYVGVWTSRSERDLPGRIKVFVSTFLDAFMISGNTLLALFDRQQVFPESQIPTLYLRVEPGSLERMASHIPRSAKATYYNADLLYPDGRWRPIEYRFRGASIWHWDPKKPSLRLRLKRNSPIQLQRHINLINPEDRPMVANLFEEVLAEKLGVLTPVTDFVRVFINGEYYGVYHRSTREDDRWLLRKRRVPGPIYIGDALKNRWAAEDFELVGDALFPEGTSPIDQMINAIYMPSGPDQSLGLWRALSFEKYARWQAAIALVGGIHSDSHHNQLFYFDPSAGLLEPATSDVNGHGTLLFARGKQRFTGPHAPNFRTPLNETLQPLLNAALRDPRYYYRRNQVLREAILEEGSYESQRQILEGYFKMIDRDVLADHRKGALTQIAAGWYRVPYGNLQYERSKGQLYEWIKNRNEFLLEELGKCEVKVRIFDPAENGRTPFLVEVDGHTAARFLTGDFQGTLSAEKVLSGSSHREIDSEELLYPGLREDETNPYNFTRYYRFAPYYLRPAPQRYFFEAEGISPDALAKILAESFRHGLTGEAVSPIISIEAGSSLEESDVTYNSVSVHVWDFPEEPAGIRVLGPGVIELTETLEIGPLEHLILEPGTRLRMGGNASLISRGRVDIRGTQDQPVVIERLHADEPWGALVIQGPGSKGSRIEHARITGGSLVQHRNVSYSGMVSVHGSDGFSLAHSTIGSNVSSDDTLHIVQSQFDIWSTSFENCYGDGIDFDFASGSVRDVTIQNAGNDGIDFMMSDVTLQNICIRQVGDKGLSCGEASNIQVFKTDIAQANIGVAVKDGSHVDLVQCELVGNVVAIDVYQKKPAYDGPGEIQVEATTFSENKIDLRTERGGKVLFIDQEAPPLRTGAGTVIQNVGVEI